MIQKEFVIVYSHVPVHFNAYHNRVVENLSAFFCLTLHLKIPSIMLVSKPYDKNSFCI